MGSSSLLRLLYNPSNAHPLTEGNTLTHTDQKELRHFAEVMRCMLAISGAKHTLLCSSKKEG